ncbi:glycosyltransferase [Sphingomonas sp. Leaf20]|uniref:glycosyltransferase n=1 Tax=Sphingomonas sp. Leaf20 TaxID=1735685 RepID=UPI000700808E|nr:glycosyltransferase [Sphingomonas sp. Leaf20]KQM73340.1 glycosyl transferase family 1 [Sphingomonas sp. Leaf20]
MSDLLFLAHRVPFPPDRGDKIRSFHVLRYLSTRMRVHLVAFADDAADLDPPVGFTNMLASCTILPRGKSQPRAGIEALATGKPVSLTAFASSAMEDAVDRILPRVGGIYCFSGQMAQYLPDDGAPAVMDFVDMDSAKFAGFADESRGPMRWMMRREARLLGAFEREIAARVSASLFVSEAEAALFRAGGATGRILAVENGIDSATFDPAGQGAILSHHPGAGRGPNGKVTGTGDSPSPSPSPNWTPASAGAAKGGVVLGEVRADTLIVFTGQMDYRPNIEAVTWFARDILPQIRARHPTARFAIVGRAPTPAVQALADDAITVTGAVDDVRGWLAAADACVAPLKLARGIQNKVLEAMAMARPVIASAAAAEGIEHAGTIRVAADATDFAAQVCAVLDAPAAAATLGQAARAQVLRRYGWDARLAPLDALFGFEGSDRTAL